MRERKTRDFNHIKCIKNEDSRVLVQEKEIKERWRSYFKKLLNENHMGNTILEERGNNREIRESIFFRRIRVSEVIFALKKIKLGRALGPDDIPIEAWKCLRDVGVSWLMKFFNKIILTKKMPDEWRKSILLPIYKNKGDIQSCTNYRGIKLMCHTMKFWRE